MTGKTQSYARQVNNRLIMQELRLCGKCSATMLANKLGLSNAALTAILFALQQKGYIKRVEQQTANKSIGRRPVYYSVNEKFGCVAVVELADNKARLVIADMNKRILHSETVVTEKYDTAAMYRLVIALKDVLHSRNFADMPLFAIELSVAGRVNVQTGQLQFSPQFDADLFADKNTLKDIFEKHFGVPVSVNNDVNLALLGELSCGALRYAQNAMLVHLDEGIGGAFVFNGKPYLGSNGFAGEAGLLHAAFNGKNVLLDDCVSLRAVKEMLSCFGRCKSFADVKALFDGNAEARAAVLSTALTLGEALRDVVELLDVSTIVLCGRLSQLDGYVEVVANVVKNSPACCNVTLSSTENASVLGAVSKAVDDLTDSLFE
ncbi:MAG: ROK family transcriptional regulator [Corallococcus sp.]|nr:ROK family transcriptional regulator [Corallococcus sp.]MCM1359028.1 ROK family transcriptional regulator [Corallococcus sp.]MCM1395017.1 ROK family transcriptional regulator [Corallococcus sp.]